LSDGGAPRAAAREVVDEEDAIGREGGSERVTILFFVRVEEEVLARGDTDREDYRRSIGFVFFLRWSLEG
jgi:hypothetical protein